MVEHIIFSHNSPEVAGEDDAINPLQSFEQQLAAFAIVKRMCETYNLYSNLPTQLGFLQRSVRLEQAYDETQTSLDQCFRKK